MPDNSQFRVQRSPSPKASPKAGPPRSKFFYGPAPGRGSAEASPASYNASTWSVNIPHDQSSTVPLRRSPDLPPYSPTQWAKNYPSHSDPAQGWDDYIPPPSAPSTGQFIDSYALMHKASHSSIDPTWDGNSPRASMDASRWSVNYQSIPMEVQKPIPPEKPPLPPRITQNQEQRQRLSSENIRLSQTNHQSIYPSKQPPSSRVSATTIDVPLFLQPYTYDPETAPPLPRRPSNTPPWDQQSPVGSPDLVPQPQRLPPPPPKIPLDRESSSQLNPPLPQRPHYDPQNSLDGGKSRQRSPQGGQRQPTFDPQDSHENDVRHPEWQQRHSSQPKIPTPQFSSFNEASALPPPSSQHSEAVSQNLQPSSTEHKENKKDDWFRAGSRSHQSSIFQNDNNTNDRWVSNHSRQDPQAAYTPSPEPQMATLAPRDGSITTTDGSSNRAGLSTPESQQTSNTSNHESVTQPENIRQEQPSNETFYWHSGRSDSDAEEDYGQADSTTATPGHSSVGKGSSIATMASTIRQLSTALPPRSTSKVTTPNIAPYGASALGFGGPSDWEYFGDYEAEEVDDEELYTRSKNPAELPVEATVASKLASVEDGKGNDREKNDDDDDKDVDDDDQPMFEIDPPPVPDRSPAREETPVFPSRDDTLHAPNHATGDYSSVRLRMSSVQSPTRLNNSWNQNDRPISYYQRPDLDDVIRAWSEAPYVGVDRNKDTPAHNTDENDEAEVDKVPEASLASTPQDKFLGIDLILKDAPEMPKLPDAIDQISPSFPSPSFGQQKFEKVSSGEHRKSEIIVKATLESQKGFLRQSAQVPQRDHGEEINVENKNFPSKDSISRISDKENVPVPSEVEHKHFSAGQQVVVHNTKVESDVADNEGSHPSKKRDLSPKAAASAKSSKGSISPTDKSSGTESLQPMPHLESTLSASRRESQLQQAEARQTPAAQSVTSTSESEAQPQSPQITRKESLAGPTKLTPIDRPLNTRKASREDVMNSSGHLPLDNGSREVARQVSKESFRDAASTLSSHPPSHEELKQASNRMSVKNDPPTATSHAELMKQNQRETFTGDHVESALEDVQKVLTRTPAPIKVTAIGPHDKNLQQDTSMAPHSNDRLSPTSGPASPKSPQSPKAVKIIDPYADLDPWGKASLNRFAAMLREEARVDSNKDKLNIFNVFTSRESRLRVVLYGTDDELILPTTPADVQENSQDCIQIDKDKSSDIPEVHEVQSDQKAGVEQAKSDQMIETKQSGKLIASEQVAIEKKLAAQLAAEEKPVMEEKPPIPQAQKKKSFVQQAIERANSAGTLKALPALPPNRDSVVGLQTGKLTSLVIKDSPKAKQQETKPETINAQMDSPSDDLQYSPGGRPIIPKLSENPSTEPKAALSKSEDRKSRIVDGQGIETEKTSAIPEAQPRPKPKTKDGDSEVNNYLTNRRSIYRPFATQTLETMESGSNFGRQSDIKIDSTPIPLLRAPSSKFNAAAQNTKNVESLPEVISDVNANVPVLDEASDKRRFVQADFDPLLMVLPEGEAKICDSHGLRDLTDIMEAIPEDFSFIHASVVAWDANTRVQREANDKARHERQAESERRIDSLFDDHEIGYGDISELEAEFKRSEAARKADEDRNEYQTFVSDVFDVVWTRLHFELDQLKPHYDRYSEMMDSTFAGKDMFEKGVEALALASTMTQFLALHQKIEIRHQKAFEAVLERDRRLKKTEISPWYTLNNIPKVKQLEKQFEDAEKKAIIEYCEQRDGRANHLMDVLDQNTLRGVGANQDYMEAIMKAVRRIASGRAYDSVPGSEEEAAASLKEVQKAQTVTALLATSSEQIVQTFHVADMLLNSADYEVSVAKAKVARVDLATLAKLKEERAKEDQKLMRDLEHRLALIREDSRRTNDEIIKLMLFLGINNGRAVEAAPRALGVHMRGGSLEASAALDIQAGHVNDPEHQERMRKALDEAKRRNEKKDSV